jgi:hypothetical protein
MKRRFALLTVALASVLGGCAALNTVYADLSSWGDWPAGRLPGRYAFDRLPSQQSDPALAARLEAAARPALEKAGFRPAEAGVRPDVLVQVAARSTRTATELWADPLWWRGGFGVHRGVWLGPTWVVGPRFESTRYERQVALLLRDAASGQPLFEARAANEGSTGGGDALLAALFQATLIDFPRHGPNPRTVHVTLP